MTTEEIQQKAEEYARLYNPDGLSPFPFENIQRENKDLQILASVKMPDDISGMILFSEEKNIYIALINANKPPTRQQFSAAHEVGHYFLHKEQIIEETFIDGENVLEGTGTLFRRDGVESTQLEREANNFAASLIMPKELIKKAWAKLQNVEDCAQVFNVSIEAMSIRLSRMGLVD